jgi:hypothetical protein
MHLLKFIIVGAAVGYGINYITKKDENGHSILEDITDDAPEWFEKAKQYAEDAVELVIKNAKAKRSF